MKIILLFVDGLGIGSSDPKINPCVQHNLNCLGCFSDNPSLIRSDPESEIVAAEATLSVPGLPQSATGQVALLTGQNAPALLGRHLCGFPNPLLREVLKSHSILKLIKEAGLTCDFLNVFRPPFFELPQATRWRLSATTGAALAAGLDFHRPEDIADCRSIYHDITGAALREKGFDVPVLTAEEAGRIVARQSRNFDLVLFEYFITDRAGHKQDLNLARQEIQKLDSFIDYILSEVDIADTLVVVTSDHGNIEDLSTKSHTLNPAMTLSWGAGKKDFAGQVHDLTDITPALLGLLGVYDRTSSINQKSD